MYKNCNNTWFAASVTSSNDDPKNKKLTNPICKITERIMISPLTIAMRFNFIGSKICAQLRQYPFKYPPRTIHRPNNRPDHSAINVAIATPLTPQPSFRTNRISKAIFNPFSQNCRTSTSRVRPAAINQPIIPYIAIAAGAL